MAYGDVGGAVTELIITCSSKQEGPVAICKGDAVSLIGNYVIDNDAGKDEIFGQAMSDCTENNVAIPIKVRGVCIFNYDPDYLIPRVDGTQGVIKCSNPSLVVPLDEINCGINLKVDKTSNQVHVLL